MCIALRYQSYCYFFGQDLQDVQDIFCLSSLRTGGLKGKKSNPPPGGRESYIQSRFAGYATRFAHSVF